MKPTSAGRVSRTLAMGVAVCACTMLASASELVVTNEMVEYASLDLPFTDDYHLNTVVAPPKSLPADSFGV